LERGDHAVILMVGMHQDAHFLFFPSVTMTYHEAILIVPNVELHDGSGPFAHLIQLQLDHVIPTVLGWLVGYPKVWSRVTPQRHGVQVDSRSGRPRSFHVAFEPHGDEGSPRDFEHFAACEKYFKQMLVSKLPSVTSPSGITVVSQFDWQLDKARLQPLTATLQGNFDLPGLNGHRTWKGIDVDRFGAFRLHCPFELVAPFSADAPEVQKQLAAETVYR
ncbi:MAG: hypothetical protein ACRD09_13920, partial [Vicinamibacterales bacterium]